MKLHVYDHCPYCVRARMALGLKGIPFEMRVQLNDDEATPISMIGKKMLPILEDADGFMGESLDIVAKVDAMTGARLFERPARPEIRGWIDTWQGVVDRLVTPRTPVAVYPEFATAAARAYFTGRRERTPGRFAALIAETDALVAELAPGLAALVPLLPRPGSISMDDILLFPVLRSLSIVPEVTLPAEVAAYRDRMAAEAGIPLFEALRLAS
ncbi:glutaredoxin 2 [Rhodobacteraceae bacterium DSL-40]|uniref:glutaredoxin 2 n=1 Tax=Amaricoccus sp. B4 TaxID=3368557 RepID=UPI000DABEA33